MVVRTLLDAALCVTLNEFCGLPCYCAWSHIIRPHHLFVFLAITAGHGQIMTRRATVRREIGVVCLSSYHGWAWADHD
jgi:hypothetical protein